METTPYSVVAYAAGLRSVGNSRADEYSTALLGQINLEYLAENPAAFLKFVQSNKCLAVMPAIRTELDGYQIEDLWPLYDLMSRTSQHRLSLLEPVFPALLEAGVDVIPYKGIDILYSFPNTVNVRFMWDVDPLVPFEEMPIAHRVLCDMGFQQVWVDRSALNVRGDGPITSAIPESEIKWVLENHHETHPYFLYTQPDWLKEELTLIEKYSVEPIIGGLPFVESNVDLHHSIASGFQATDIWASDRRVQLSGPKVYRGLGLEAYLCLYLGRTYSITHTLRDASIQTLFDAARILAHSDVDWVLVRYLVEKYRLFAPAYYVLHELALILGDEIVPPYEVEYYNRLLEANREYDLGEFATKMFGIVKSASVLEVLSAS